MDRTNTPNTLGGQVQDRAGDEDVVAGTPPVDDHLRLQLPQADRPAGPKTYGPTLAATEPPIILPMTQKEAGLLVNLLALEMGPDASELRYRLITKYIQAGYRFPH